jgi:hypothetical protein
MGSTSWLAQQHQEPEEAYPGSNVGLDGGNEWSDRVCNLVFKCRHISRPGGINHLCFRLHSIV